MGKRTLALLLGCAMVSAAGVARTNARDEPVHGGEGITLPAPPATERKPVTDDLHGVTITDPYRWLEDAKSPETRAWIDAENKYTADYLGQVKQRPEIVAALTRLERVDFYTVPALRGGRYFFEKRLADENQRSIYMRQGWSGEDVRLVDANRLSADQNTSVNIEDISSDGTLLAYGVRAGGADQQEVHTFDVNARKEYADHLPAARYFGVAIAPDRKGLYYSRYSDEGTTVYFHRFGDDAAKDAAVFPTAADHSYRGEKLGGLDLISIDLSDDGHYLLITIAHGVPAKREDILVKDLTQPDSTPLATLVYGIESRFSGRYADGAFYVSTDYKSPKGRIARAALNTAPEQWTTIVPEGANVIDQWSVVGGKLFVERLVDVKSRTTVYALDGKQTGEIEYPGIGSADTLQGRAQDTEGFYSFQSFNVPPSIFRYDTKTGKSDLFARPKVPFDSSRYEVQQVFYTSKDGTRVPMFIAGKKGLARDGKARVLMTAYGGFNVSLSPDWSPVQAWWMEQGGLFALPNLRGGGEYGEDWHKAGMFEKKQNVFDDFFAAAEYLIANHYTSADRLAIEGASNGGLLMGAAMTQRPDLFGAIWCGYPLLDMLRYQNFLVGRFWTTEYGSAENAEQMKYILRYSPYQNVKPGGKYPAIMFFTGDSDTRVDPLHARKMTALMQADSGSGRPVLLHYSLKGGHSAGVSTEQLVNDQADELAFLWTETAGH